MSHRPNTALDRTCLTASSSARLTFPGFASGAGLLLMNRLQRCCGLLNLDRFLVARVIDTQVETVFDDLSQRLAGSLFPMREEDTRLRLCKRFEPTQEIGLTGMAAQSAEGMHRGTDGNLLAHDVDRFLPVHEHPSQRTVPLIADDEHRRFGAREIMPEVM